VFGNDAFGTEMFADCAAETFPRCVLAGRSDDIGKYSALPGVDIPGGSTTDILPGTYVVKGVVMFVFDTIYPALPDTILFGVDARSPLLDIGGFGK
jgi:hypothetical protein